MKTTRRILLTVAMAIFSFVAKAQTKVAAQPEQVDFMRSNEKIYVVMAVILVIMLGFFSYLIRLDRKITKLESKS